MDGKQGLSPQEELKGCMRIYEKRGRNVCCGPFNVRDEPGLAVCAGARRCYSAARGLGTL